VHRGACLFCRRLTVFDTKLRTLIGPRLERAGARLASKGVKAGTVTAAAFTVGVGACVAAGFALWTLALVLWLVNRALDGLDGPVARATAPTDRGGYLDVVSDFTVYGGFVLAVAIAVPDARLACAVLLLSFYVSGSALLALSSVLERRRQNDSDGRSVRLTGGLAEGFETIVAFSLFCLLPSSAAVIAWTFAAVVGITAIQRVLKGAALLQTKRVEQPPR
jgi:phosphatidylglycerophosphate synthase